MEWRSNKVIRWPRGAASRDVLAAVALKLALLAALYVLFFSPSHRPASDAAATARAVAGADFPGDRR